MIYFNQIIKRISRSTSFITNVSTLILLLFLAGCSNENTSTPLTAYFNTPNKDFQTTINYNQTGLFVVVESNEAWVVDITAAGNWCTAQSQNGTGNKNIWIATTVNNSETQRIASIKIIGNNGTVLLELTQKGNGNVPPDEETLSAALAGTLPLAWDSDGINMTVTSNTDWTVSFTYPSGTAAWCSTSSTNYSNNATVWISTTANAASTTRSATVTVTSATKSVSLTLSQERKPATPPSIAGRWELPAIVDYDWFLEYTKGVFAMEYDLTKKHSKWVAWPLHAGHFGSSGRTNAWQQDPRIPPANRATDADFPNGYDKGHMCSSGERTKSKEMNEQTFFYSNMSPQKSDLNQGIWNQLELFERKWAEKAGDTLYICSGGTIMKESDILFYNNGLAVPKYHFKVILRKRGANTWNAIGFWFENKDYSARTKAYFLSNLDNLMKSVDEIEELTGLDFFYLLPDNIQTQVEAQKSKSDWDWS